MSTAPGPLDKLVQNRTALAAVGLGGGLIALCGGFFVMALATIGVLRNDSVAGGGGDSTSGGSTTPARKSTDPINFNSAGEVVQQFLKHAQAGQWDEAYSLTTPGFRSETVDAFRSRMDKAKGVRGFQRSRLKQSTLDGGGEMYRGFLITGSNELRVEMEMLKAGDEWRVERFAISP